MLTLMVGVNGGVDEIGGSVHGDVNVVNVDVVFMVMLRMLMVVFMVMLMLMMLMLIILLVGVHGHVYVDDVDGRCSYWC